MSESFGFLAGILCASTFVASLFVLKYCPKTKHDENRLKSMSDASGGNIMSVAGSVSIPGDKYNNYVYLNSDIKNSPGPDDTGIIPNVPDVTTCMEECGFGKLFGINFNASCVSYEPPTKNCYCYNVPASGRSAIIPSATRHFGVMNPSAI